MIEALRNEDLALKVGGRFKLTVLIQRRWVQLLQGARPMVECKGLTEMETIIKEIIEDKIEMRLPEEFEEHDADEE